MTAITFIAEKNENKNKNINEDTNEIICKIYNFFFHYYMPEM